MKLSERRQSRQSLQKAEALQSRALRLTLQGKYSRAANVYRAAVVLLEKHPFCNRELFAALLNDYGVLLKYTGRLAQAQKLYERASRIMPREGAFSINFRATLCHNLAGLAHARGQYARALRQARHGIRLRRRVRSDVSSVLADQAALAAILVEMGQLREARTIYFRVLRAYRTKFGANHRETGFVLSNLGALHLKAGRLNEADGALRRAARVLEGVLGRNHPRLATVLNNLAVVLACRGKPLEAEALYARVLRLLSRQPRHAYPSATIVRANRKAARIRLF